MDWRGFADDHLRPVALAILLAFPWVIIWVAVFEAFIPNNLFDRIVFGGGITTLIFITALKHARSYFDARDCAFGCQDQFKRGQMWFARYDREKDSFEIITKGATTVVRSGAWFPVSIEPKERSE